MRTLKLTRNITIKACYQALYAAWQKGSIVAGAGHLGIGVTTAYRRIYTLEEFAGFELFVRQPRGFRLTPGGRRVLNRYIAWGGDALHVKGTDNASSSRRNRG